MIYDTWRTANFSGEVNDRPSMTQPARVFSVMDYLTRPDLVLQQRTPFAEVEIDPSDETAIDKVPDPEDIHDNFEYEVPRDPDLYGSKEVRPKRRRRAAPAGAAPAEGDDKKAPQAKTTSPEAADGAGSGNVAPTSGKDE